MALSSPFSRLAFLSTLLLALVTAACEPGDVQPPVDLPEISVQAASAADQAAAEADLASAVAFRASVDEWRAGKFGEQTWTGDELAVALTNTYNILFAEADAVLGEQTTIRTDVAFPAAGGEVDEQAAAAAYEGLRQNLEQALAPYGNEAVLRFVVVGKPVAGLDGEGALPVIFNVGAAGDTPVVDAPLAWTQASDDAVDCGGSEPLGADAYITNAQNRLLAQRIEDAGEGRAALSVDANALVFIYPELQGEFQLLEYPGSSTTFGLDRLARDNGPDYTSAVVVDRESDFGAAGQYLVHYSEGGDERCFSAEKLEQYVTDQSTIGDGILLSAVTAQEGLSSTQRVGAYTTYLFNQQGEPSEDVRAHTSQFIYGKVLYVDDAGGGMVM